MLALEVKSVFTQLFLGVRHMLLPRDSRIDRDITKQVEWARITVAGSGLNVRKKPPESDWSYILGCVSCHSLEFSVLLCFDHLSLLWDGLTIRDPAKSIS